MNNFGYILAFLLGLGGGVIASRLYYEKQIDNYEKEIETFMEDAKALQEEFIKDAKTLQEKLQKEQDSYEEAKKEYEKIEKEEHEEKVEVDNFNKDAEIYPISLQQFDNEANEGFDRLTLYYYEEDDTLADENEEIISNAEEIIGDSLLYFDDDDSAIYIRNNKIGALLEVLVVHGSYARDVLGIVEE